MKSMRQQTERAARKGSIWRDRAGCKWRITNAQRIKDNDATAADPQARILLLERIRASTRCRVLWERDLRGDYVWVRGK